MATLSIGIIGLVQSGRTTVFKAITGGHGSGGSNRDEGHLGNVRVPDDRIAKLVTLSRSKKAILAEVMFLEIGTSVKNISGQLLNQLTQVDALLSVVRAFPSDSVPHPEGSLDIERDMEATNLEVIFSDLAIIERRLNKLGSSLKAAKGTERQHFIHEQELLYHIKKTLEEGTSLRETELSDAERQLLKGYDFLSNKPLLTVINIGESQLEEAKIIEEKFQQQFGGSRHLVMTFCAELEKEIAELDEQSSLQFCAEYGIDKAGRDRVIKTAYSLLNLISFLTSSTEESRAWPVSKGTTALHAAAKIHTDIARGFIRAEVIPYQDLVRIGSITEGRRKGLLRSEGKQYIIKDGDVIHFLFNV